MYSFCDSIVCISLKGNVERQNHVRNIGKSLHIPIDFYLPNKHPTSGRIGCFESHLNVIRTMYNNPHIKIGMILEDDFVPTIGYSNKLVNEASTFMMNDDSWEMFQLGYSPFYSPSDITGLLHFVDASHVTKHVVKHTGVLMHAYCISRKGMKKILDYVTPEIIKTMHIDEWIIYVINKGYCITPMLFEQKVYKSDNTYTGFMYKALNTTYVKSIAERYHIFYYISFLPLIQPYLLFLAIVVFLVLILLTIKLWFSSTKPRRK